MRPNILAVEWRGAGTVGIVAVSRTGGQWKAYMRSVTGISPDVDAEFVAEYGSPLIANEAAAFFPNLDIKLYAK